MLLHNQKGQDPGVVAGLLEDLERLNPVSRGMLLPYGEAGPLDCVKRLLGFVPSWIETFSARSVKMRALLARDFIERFGQREGSRHATEKIPARGYGLESRLPVADRGVASA